MSAPKLKNLIIVILLLANLFLLLLVVPSRLSSRQQNRRANEALATLYAQKGVTLSAEIIPQSLPLQPSTLSLNPEDSIRAVCALLGEDTLVTQEETEILFSSPKGGASITYGVLEVLLDLEASDPMAAAKKCLSTMGAEAYRLYAAEEEGQLCYHADFIAAQGTVLDRPLTFYFENGRLVRILGFLLPVEQSVLLRDSEICITAQDALLEFIAARERINWTGTEILSVTQGWTLLQNISQGNVPLQPAWRVETNSGTYLVDGISRSVRFLS